MNISVILRTHKIIIRTVVPNFKYKILANSEFQIYFCTNENYFFKTCLKTQLTKRRGAAASVRKRFHYLHFLVPVVTGTVNKAPRLTPLMTLLWCIVYTRGYFIIKTQLENKLVVTIDKL